MKVAVVGCGYVGLVTGVGFASLGHEVVGVDIDRGRVEAIAQGVVPFYEPGVAETLATSLRSGRYRISGSVEQAKDAEVVFLCVQTPSSPQGTIDLQFLETATRQLAAALGAAPPGERIIAIRSTVSPGTTEGMVAQILRHGAMVSGARVGVAANPEFLREGSALYDFFHADRVVVGAREEWVADRLADLYSGLDAPVIRTTPATAELAKYASNAFLATLISFSNEVARLCEATPEVDVEDVLGILHQDPRLRGPQPGEPAEIVSYLKAGVGFGGSCLPKDLAALVAYAESVGEEAPLLRAVGSVNDAQPERLLRAAEQALGDLEGRAVALLGLAFKAGTADVRESPGLKLVDGLLERGAKLAVYDPLVARAALGGYEARGVRIATHLADALEGADACILTTGAAEFQEVTSLLRERDGRAALLIDGRRVLSPKAFPLGRYYGIGRWSPEPARAGGQ